MCEKNSQTIQIQGQMKSFDSEAKRLRYSTRKNIFKFAYN